jgi:hypothetical protein
MTEHLRARLGHKLGREPESKELATALAAALEHRRESLVEYATPDAEHIEAAAAANKNAIDTAPPGTARFDACKSAPQWVEPERPKRAMGADDLNRAARAKWDKWNAQIADFEEKHPERAGFMRT